MSKIIHVGDDIAAMLPDGSIQFSNIEKREVRTYKETDHLPSGQLCALWKIANGFELNMERNPSAGVASPTAAQDRVLETADERIKLLKNGSIEIENKTTGETRQFNDLETLPNGMLCADWKVANGFPLVFEVIEGQQADDDIQQ